MTDVQANLLSGIIGAVIGGVIGFIGSNKIANRQIIVDAGYRLRDAFRDELAAFEAPGKIDAYSLLDRGFQKHLKAITEFRYALPKRKHQAFDQAWQEYHCIGGTGDAPLVHFLEQYTTNGVSLGEGHANRQLAIQRIKQILSFTV